MLRHSGGGKPPPCGVEAIVLLGVYGLPALVGQAPALRGGSNRPAEKPAVPAPRGGSNQRAEKPAVPAPRGGSNQRAEKPAVPPHGVEPIGQQKPAMPAGGGTHRSRPTSRIVAPCKGGGRPPPDRAAYFPIPHKTGCTAYGTPGSSIIQLEWSRTASLSRQASTVS